MPQACSECNHRTADAGEKRRARAKGSSHEQDTKWLAKAWATKHPGFCGQDVTERGTDGVFARRQLSDNGVRGANWGTERFSRYSKKRGVSKKREEKQERLFHEENFTVQKTIGVQNDISGFVQSPHLMERILKTVCLHCHTAGKCFPDFKGERMRSSTGSHANSPPAYT